MNSRYVRLAVAISAMTSLVIVASNSMVSADEFKPLPGPPEVNILTFTDEIQPANPVSDGTLVEVQATVETNALLDDLSTVTLCMYKTEGVGTVQPTAPYYDGTNTHSDTEPCGGLGGTPNAANSVQIVWTEQSADTLGDGQGGFNIIGSIGDIGPGGNEHAINGSTACTSGDPDASPTSTCEYDEEEQFVTLTFKFRVSYALLAGTDWNYKVSAEIPDSACGDATCSELGIDLSPESFRGSDEVGTDKDGAGPDTAETITVLYYGEVRTGATDSASDFGYLQDTQTSDYETYDAFDYLTNGMSQLTLTGTDFSRASGDTLSLVQTVPSTEEVALSCYDSLDWAVVEEYVAHTDDSATELDYQRDPTIEEVTDGSITCRLTYGGGADVALATYSNTVTVGIADAR